MPTPHWGHAPPPQSMPVSLPFLTLSLHAAARHVPPAHTRVVQSVPLAQPLSTAHGLHEPPQSTSVSWPFFTWSLQSGAAHFPPVQTPSAQSDEIEHAFPVVH